MLVAAAHSPAWRSQSYTCLTCRQAQARALRRQVRWNSEHHAPLRSSSNESRIDSLNNINDEYSLQPASPKQEDKSKDESQQAKVSKTAVSKRDKKPSATTIESLFSTFGKKLRALWDNTDPAPIAPSVDDGRTSRERRDRMSLSKSQAGKEKKQLRKGVQEWQAESSLLDTNSSPSQDSSRLDSFDVPHLRSLISRLQSETKANAAEREKQSHNEGAVSGVNQLASADLEGTEARPLPSFRSSGGKPLSLRGGHRRALLKESRQGSGNDTSVGQNPETEVRRTQVPIQTIPVKSVETNSGASISARRDSTLGKAMRLVDRHRRHLQDLTPFRLTQTVAGGDVVSFSSLRGADKVTPETIISTSNNHHPFGLSISDYSTRRTLEDRNAVKESSPTKVEDESSGPSDVTDVLSKPAASIPKSKKEKSAATDASVQLSEPKEPRRKGPRKAKPPATPKTPSRNRILERRRQREHRDLQKTKKNHRAINGPTDRQGSNSKPTPKAGVSIAEAMNPDRKERAVKRKSEPSAPPPDDIVSSTEFANSCVPSELQIAPLDIPQPPVPYLQYGLDRVLFNPGVYQLQNNDSRVFNFDPYLQKIMPVIEFDFNALKQYKTSSEDHALSALARQHTKKYIGSTSSMTSSLAHFHYLLSNWRLLNLEMLSNGFIGNSTKATFTEINRAPSAIFLRWKNGAYAIDADKEYDGGNVLMLLGKSMELLLTLPKDEYERYRKSDPRQVPEEQKNAAESFQYTTMGDFLMRSQLDAYDPRLPGNGTFDLKTRAVVSVRMSAQDYEPMTGYEIQGLQGKWTSYEREYYDMMRSTMLKYMLQARMGRMNGIFVAYHNVERIFGFQYIPIHEMDRALHGQRDTCLGDQEFRASLDMLNEVLNRATARFPEQSLRIHFETRPGDTGGIPSALHAFAEPMTDDEIDGIQNCQKAKIIAWERDAMGKDDQNVAGMETDLDNDDMTLEANLGTEVDTESFTNLEPLDQADTTEGEHEADMMTSSDADADVAFLDSIEQQDRDLKPLFHATIIMQSKVNGQVPDGNRPRDLGKNDKWEIDYILKEYDTTRIQWALYDDTKARRKHALAEREVAEASDEGEAKPDYYMQFLRKLATEGRERRGRIDETEAGQEVSWFDEGLPKQREKIGGVEDYMSWLYNNREA